MGDKKIHADMVADAKKRQSLQEQLEICQAKQKEAVLEEDYEKAAYYRDEIKRLRKGFRPVMKWYEEKDAENDVIVASRIRLLRNLRDYKFPWKLEEEDAKG